MAKVMTDVWKPGAFSKAEAVPNLCLVENFGRLVITPNNLNIGLEVNTAFFRSQLLDFGDCL